MRLCLLFCLLPALLYAQNPPDQFIYLKGGAFLMGDAPGDQLAADETPHRVHLSPFYRRIAGAPIAGATTRTSASEAGVSEWFGGPERHQALRKRL